MQAEGLLFKRGIAEADAPVWTRKEVAAWCRVHLASRPGVSDDESRCAAFPYRAVAAHWQAAGRARADGPTVGLVHAATARLVDDSAAGAGSWAWFLRNWLPSLTDIQRGECTYATYVGLPVLHGLVVPTPSGESVYPSDAVTATILALLLQFEIQAARRDPSWDRPNRHRRIHVLGNALAHHRGPFVTRDDVAPMWPSFRAAHRPGDEVDAAARLADRVAHLTPRPLYDFLELLALPATPTHDEVMFIRTLQLFETVFAVMAHDVAAARDALQSGDTQGGTALISQARGRLVRSMPFFRILGTMPRSSFADIRHATPGASGLQSESFKQIELACARQTDSRLSSPGYTEPNVRLLADAAQERPTIEELAQASDSPALREAMKGLDRAWRQWKKTHWAIAVRLIGAVPGTGGTEGAAYLRHHMTGPLFLSLGE